MKKRKLSLIMVAIMLSNTTATALYASQIPQVFESGIESVATTDQLQLVKANTMQLTIPKTFSGTIKWESSNPHIAEINEMGIVQGKEKGSAVITARDEKNEEISWKVDILYTEEVMEVDQVEFTKMREYWLNSLVGLNSDLQSENVQRVIARVDGFAEQHWEGLKTDGSVLWETSNVAKYETDPAHIRTMYLNLEWMAKAYVTPASKYYQNQQLLEDIKYSLEWLNENAYYEREQYGNWWQWEIGIPKALNNICVMLYDELGKDLVLKYTDAVYFHQPDPFHSGASGVSKNAYRESEAANRVDVSLVSLVLGMVREDSEQLLMTKDAISSLLKYESITSEGKYIDGFYEDGSFIQHGHVPYVGTYGNVFLSGASTIASTLKETPWELSTEALDILTAFGVDSFAPFIYKGAAMDMVRGRAISRNNETDRKSGHAIMGSILQLSEVVSEDLAPQLKALAKTWITEDTVTDFVSNTNNINLINLAEEVLNDIEIETMASEMMHKNFPLMDRVVHKGNQYAFGVSMFSSRISNFEYMNGENIKGWHTADGMTYLYNEDLLHYTDNYWNTVNPYRLPGTTVDTVKLDREELPNNGPNGQKLFSKEDWVGGVTIGNYGANGMSLNGDLVTDKGEDSVEALAKSLKAKKSYFMFDDEIVCLGADINSTENRTIETIVENRKIKDDGSNKIVVENKEELKNLEETTIKSEWVHLEGNVEGADIGYYFPQQQEITMRKVQNTGKWEDVRMGSPKDEVTKTYVEMWFNHGSSPQNATYEYVILPNKNVEETNAYAMKPQVEILSNTEKIQAVKAYDLGILAANFWVKDGGEVDGLKVNGASSVMMQKKDNKLTVALADPTMKNTGTIELEILESAKSVIVKDERIKVKQLAPTIKLEIDVRDAKGMSIEAIFNLNQ